MIEGGDHRERVSATASIEFQQAARRQGVDPGSEIGSLMCVAVHSGPLKVGGQV